jgi:predicted Zn-dependent peptidase
MADYFQRHYGPGNMVLSATGKMDFGELIEWAEEFCGSWPATEAARAQSAPRYKAQRIELTDGKLSRQYTMGMTPGPSAQDERRFAARVLADVIGDAEGSRLYWSLVEPAIAEEAEFGFYPHDGCGSFYVSLVTEPDRAEKALAIAVEQLKLVQTNLTDAEVERTKNKIGGGIVLQGEAPMGRMPAIGSQWVYNKEYRSLEQDMASLEAVTTQSLRELMSEYPFEPMTVASLGPGQAGAQEHF